MADKKMYEHKVKKDTTDDIEKINCINNDNSLNKEEKAICQQTKNTESRRYYGLLPQIKRYLYHRSIKSTAGRGE